MTIAAIIYEGDERPDGTLAAFASELRRGGARVAGLVQRLEDQETGQISVTLLPSGEEICLMEMRGAAASGCRLDVARLHEAGSKVDSAIDAGADIVIINRFGRQEQEGKGLRYLIERALTAEIPVLIAVSQEGLDAWTEFAAGLSVRLPGDLASLRRWWSSLNPQLSRTA